MGMIDEIKDRLNSACAGAAYLDCEGMPLESEDGPDAEEDMRWMLERIEQLESSSRAVEVAAEVEVDRE